MDAAVGAGRRGDRARGAARARPAGRGEPRRAVAGSLSALEGRAEHVDSHSRRRAVDGPLPHQGPHEGVRGRPETATDKRRPGRRH